MNWLRRFFKQTFETPDGVVTERFRWPRTVHRCPVIQLDGSLEGFDWTFLPCCGRRITPPTERRARRERRQLMSFYPDRVTCKGNP